MGAFKMTPNQKRIRYNIMVILLMFLAIIKFFLDGYYADDPIEGLIRLALLPFVACAVFWTAVPLMLVNPYFLASKPHNKTVKKKTGTCADSCNSTFPCEYMCGKGAKPS